MSSSRATQNTWQQDNRRVIGQGGVSAEGSNVNIQYLDGDAINRAFSFGDSALASSLGFGSEALSLLGDAINESFGFGRDALSIVGDANADALAFAESNARMNSANAYNFAGDALGGALGFGETALNRAFSLTNDAASLVKDAYADAKGRGAMTDQILLGAIAAMAIVAFMAIKK